MPDSWEKQHFGNLTTAAISTDFDGDGQSDAAEYVAGTDPKNAGDYLRIVSHTYANGQTQVTLQFTSQPSRRYRLQESTDLVNWNDSGLGTFDPDTGATTTKAFGFTGNARHFFRAVAVLPLEGTLSKNWVQPPSITTLSLMRKDNSTAFLIH